MFRILVREISRKMVDVTIISNCTTIEVGLLNSTEMTKLAVHLNEVIRDLQRAAHNV